jgi:hypothetical protein
MTLLAIFTLRKYVLNSLTILLAVHTLSLYMTLLLIMLTLTLTMMLVVPTLREYVVVFTRH